MPETGILDGLEEYYGIIAKMIRFSDPMLEFCQRIFGINDLYVSVIDRRDAVIFGITTNYSRNSMCLSFWLTVLFGSLDTGILTKNIVSIYYFHSLSAIVARTAFITVLTFLMIFALPFRKIE